MAAKVDRNRTKFMLDEKDIPTKWYNIQADFKTPAPPVLHPGTKQPIGPADLAPLFPMELIKQEVSRERWIEIPDEVRDVYRLWRPIAAYRARRLEKALGTPAHIYYKYEGVSPAGSHKPNTAIAQAYYNKKEGVTRLSHRDRRGPVGLGAGAGVPDVRHAVQGLHGQGLLPAEAVSPDHDGDLGRPGRGQPQPRHAVGQEGPRAGPELARLARHRHQRGRRGRRHARRHEVLARQRAQPRADAPDRHRPRGQEAAREGRRRGRTSSSAAPAAAPTSPACRFPFAADKLTGKNKKMRIIAVEPAACPSLTKGSYVYDFGDTVGLTPLVKMHTLGHTFIPAPLHAGGLRYHGMAPAGLQALRRGRDRGARRPAAAPPSRPPCSSRAPRASSPRRSRRTPSAWPSTRPLRCKKEGKRKTILFNLSGHGHFDLGAYEAYLAGKLQDYEYPTRRSRRRCAACPRSRRRRA